METLEKRKQNLHEAIVSVMKAVKNIDKGMQVGSGNFGYKGVADKDVKQAIGQAMSDNGLTCVPTNIQPTMTVDRWEVAGKPKQSVFTEVLVTYRITHAESGETIDIMGYGHGQDAMDKSAGKATTYALKNALLYSFLVPTGVIDDTDATHSKNIPTPPKAKPVLSQADFERGMNKMEATAFKEFMKKYELTDIQEAALKLL